MKKSKSLDKSQAIRKRLERLFEIGMRVGFALSFIGLALFIVSLFIGSLGLASAGVACLLIGIVILVLCHDASWFVYLFS